MKAKTLVLLLALATLNANANVAIIVHPSASFEVSDADVSKIFLGKAKSFPDGSPAIPVNQAEETETAKAFSDKVLNKSASQLKAYWSKLVFTGKGTPPKEVANDQEVLQLVAANPNIIGYVNASAVSDSVKVVSTH